ncbi:hypothetical protein HPB49_018594 [Dermacentor silvarum]|uniref:Uncharacterized protein n=1 Tax=Dermacentor silvarum TaxID=543639 RepID=A0ACB8CSW4_DERSI|nr:hypothetical protein HPB49_018594 [Dermacentor silvarum]
MGRNVATFLWRTLYVQAMRRHYLSTSFQLLLVICAFSLALHNRKAPEPLGRKPNGTELDSFLVSQRPTHVVFGPNTSYNKRLMEAVVAMFSTDDTEQGDEVLSMAYNASAVSELAKHCANVATNSKRTVRPLCVTLETPADSDGHADASLKYTVFKPFPVNESQLFVSNFAGFAVGYMYAIEQAHLELQRRRTAWSVESSDNDMKMVVEDLPGWVYGDATVAYRQEFTWTIYVVFLIPALRSLNAIEYELSSGLAEKQALMGLSAVQFALGHFFTTAAFYVAESAIVIMLMYTVKVGWNHVSYAYGIDPSMVLISFFLYDVGQALTPVLVTSVCPKGLKAH